MVQISFKQDSVRYCVTTVSEGLREREARMADIRPDPSLWANAAEKRLVLNLGQRSSGLTKREQGRLTYWRNVEARRKKSRLRMRALRKQRARRKAA